VRPSDQRIVADSRDFIVGVFRNGEESNLRPADYESEGVRDADLLECLNILVKDIT
jgi:hypothetical protein